MSQGTAVFVGHAVLDHTFGVPSLEPGAGKHLAHRYEGRIGGLAARAALAAQALRTEGSPAVRLLTACGDDDAGRWLRAGLQAAGVDIGGVAIVEGARTSVSAVLVDPAGERQLHNFRGDAFERAPLPDAALLRDALAVQVDPRWPAAARRALAQCRAEGRLSLLDAEVAPRSLLRELVPLADWVVFSSAGWRAWAGVEGTGESLLGATALDAVAETAPAAQLVLTRGGAPALWRQPDGRHAAIAAHRVQAVDTNGAGDTLHGALLLALAQGRPPEAALARAMAAAALACSGAAVTPAAVVTITGDS